MRTFLLSGVVFAGLAGSSLHVDAADAYIWQRGSNAFWSTSAASTNWVPAAGGAPTPWVQGGEAVFTNEPSPQVTVENGVMRFSRLTVTGIADDNMRIEKVSGNDVDRLFAEAPAIVSVEPGTTLALPTVEGTNGFTLVGGGAVDFYRSRSWSGPLRVLNGIFRAMPAGSRVHLLDTNGAHSAQLQLRGINSGWLVNLPVLVQGGSSGTATIENAPTTGDDYRPTLASALTLSNELRLVQTGKAAVWTVSGKVEGPADLIFEPRAYRSGVVFTGASSNHTGRLRFPNPQNRGDTTTRFDGWQGHCRIVASNTVLTGDGTLVYNVVQGQADGIRLDTGSTLVATNLALAPFVKETRAGQFVIAEPASAVVGPFRTENGFTVDYDGTDLYPDAVVLIWRGPPGTVLVVR